MNNQNPDMRKHFNETLSFHHDHLLCILPDAVDECRLAEENGSLLNQEGEEGLQRLLNVWCRIHPTGQRLVLTGYGPHLMAVVLALIYARLVLRSLKGEAGLALCTELEYMTDSLLQGDWFE